MQALGRALIVLALITAGLVAGKTRLDSQNHFLSTQRYEDVYYLPPPGWLKLFSLGYREALAGYVWMRTLIYFGDEMVHRGKTKYLYTYADAMLELDPFFAKAYRWIATTGAYRAYGNGLPDIKRSIQYLERAARIFPDDGEIAWDLASFYLYELKPHLKDKKEREAANRKGLEHLQVAVLRGAGPPWLALNTASQLEEMGQREQQIAFLQEAYGQVSSDDVRLRIEQELAHLQSASFAEAFTREQAQAEAARKRDYPYLDMDLFLQVGSKPAFDHLPLLLNGFDPSPVVDDVADAETLPAGAAP
jgi:tetratricopeptide (TPR) repeat protein